MSDPFRPNTKSQLQREATIGLSIVAILLTLFVYVAFYKITGRGQVLPDHVRNAPVAELVWPRNPGDQVRQQEANEKAASRYALARNELNQSSQANKPGRFNSPIDSQFAKNPAKLNSAVSARPSQPLIGTHNGFTPIKSSKGSGGGLKPPKIEIANNKPNVQSFADSGYASMASAKEMAESKTTLPNVALTSRNFSPPTQSANGVSANGFVNVQRASKEPKKVEQGFMNPRSVAPKVATESNSKSQSLSDPFVDPFVRPSTPVADDSDVKLASAESVAMKSNGLRDSSFSQDPTDFKRPAPSNNEKTTFPLRVAPEKSGAFQPLPIEFANTNPAKTDDSRTKRALPKGSLNPFAKPVSDSISNPELIQAPSRKIISMLGDGNFTANPIPNKGFGSTSSNFKVQVEPAERSSFQPAPVDSAGSHNEKAETTTSAIESTSELVSGFEDNRVSMQSPRPTKRLEPNGNQFPEASNGLNPAAQPFAATSNELVANRYAPVNKMPQTHTSAKSNHSLAHSNHTSAIGSVDPKAVKLANDSKTGEHVVVDGDSFWSISQQAYDDGGYYGALYQYNKTLVKSFDSLEPGTRIQTPSLSQLRLSFPELCPKDEPTENLGTPNQLAPRIYVTERGDTLFGIARQRLDQANRYLDILKLNEDRLGSSISHLAPLGEGIRLVLPSD